MVHSSRQIGKVAEDIAIEYLQDLGFIIVDRNYYTRFGELDVIAMKGDTLHFVEVKSGKGFDPIYNITPKKLKNIIKTAEIYICKKKLNLPFVIDILSIKDNNIKFTQNISFDL